MVLPESAAHDAHGQAVAWADEIALSLGLSSGGSLVLVDKAHPARLGDLVRTLRHTWPDVDVIADVRALDDLAEGAVIVLAPRPENADWLNMRRQTFADKKLKVVFWCDAETTLALARGAPDLYDWIGHRQECPPGPAPFAVAGMRAAFQMEWPVAWSGTPTREAVEEVVRAALPGEEAIAWFDGALEYEKLLDAMEAARIVGVDIGSPRQLRRVRWAYAESRRKGRLILILRELECPGFWPVADRFGNLRTAIEQMAKNGYSRGPGRLCAMLDLEPELLDFALTVHGEGLETAAALSMDPAEGISRSPPRPKAKKKLFSEVEPDAWLSGIPWKMRAFAARKSAVDDFMARAHAWHSDDLGPKEAANHSFPAGAALRSGESDSISFLACSTEAIRHSETSIALRWLRRSSSMAPSGSFQGVIRKLLQDGEQSASALADYLHGPIAGALLNDIRKHARFGVVAVFVIVGFSLLGIGFGIASLVRWTLDWTLSASFASILVSGMAWIAGFHVANASTRLRSRNDFRFIERISKEVGEIQGRLSFYQSHPPLAPRYTLLDDLGRETRESIASLGAAHPLCLRYAQIAAEAFLERGDAGEAWKLLAPALQEDAPIPAGIAVLACRCLTEMGRAGEAIFALANLLDLDVAAPLQPTRDEPGKKREGPLPVLRDTARRGLLAESRTGHLALIDALLKQGRYPEALQVARKAIAHFKPHDGSPEDLDALKKIEARLIDLERRLGPRG